ncbi:MAG: solute:Na+ symporter, family [Baekduia sp.]|jgi:SSS family solute:Na+ symporter|nr:solute:Na+ symporter, family [Baekduia sp.]MDX6700017.1 solute:Na+ symporter, family [Baekduia sp.]
MTAVSVAHDTQAVTLAVFLVLFIAVTVIGFVAARWQRAGVESLDEWGLGGRRFGSVITWFLLGGDLYTAYTFVAVPALVFGVGAQGFFALPYTILVYPLVFVALPRLWTVAHRKGYVTPADFVRGRFGSRGLATAIALTGLLATMPYIALQLVGIQVVLATMGITGDWPLILAFAILAGYTYQSGLRAPALIAVVKDVLIYVTIIVAVIYIPGKLGGFGHIFDTAGAALSKKDPPGALIPSTTDAQVAYATLALGSAMALFLYPHALTASLSASSAQTLRRNAAVLPAYSFLLGLIALLGYMAITAGIQPSGPNYAVPDLLRQMFPSWFTGVAFAAIAIGALVPAAVMSIAAANLFTRNLWAEYVNPSMTDGEEQKVAKIVSLGVKLGALIFILVLPTKYAIDLQLLGGVWILQTMPSVALGLYGRLHRHALLAGWAVGMAVGTAMAIDQSFKSSIYALDVLGIHINAYEAMFALAANLVVAVLGTLLLNALKVPNGADQTTPEDFVEPVAGSEKPLPATPEQEARDGRFTRAPSTKSRT